MLSVACLQCNLFLLHQMRNFWPHLKVGFFMIFQLADLVTQPAHWRLLNVFFTFSFSSVSAVKSWNPWLFYWKIAHSFRERFLEIKTVIQWELSLQHFLNGKGERGDIMGSEGGGGHNGVAKKPHVVRWCPVIAWIGWSSGTRLGK